MSTLDNAFGWVLKIVKTNSHKGGVGSENYLAFVHVFVTFNGVKSEKLENLHEENEAWKHKEIAAKREQWS